MPSWAVHCVRCETLLATQDVVAFVQENVRAVHVGLRHELFTEQAESASHDAERTLRCSHGDLWFSKVRQPSVKKRAMCPFVLQCPCCCGKVGSQFVMTGWRRAEHLFDMKACAILVSSNAESSVKERVAFKRVSQLMDLLLEKQLPVDIQQARVAIETSEESDDGDGGGTHDPRRTKTRPTPPAAMVWPTVDSVRAYFGDNQAHSKLSTLRDYQVELVVGAALENTIIYLPTGCGKTLVAVKTIMMMKALNPSRKAAFFVPTVPLVSQQASYLRRESDLSVLELSGQTSSSSNRRNLKTTDAVVVTPQFFNNLLHNREVAMDQFCVLVFDEAHHAVKGHPYCDILQQVALLTDESRPRIVALTASPFGQKAATPSMEANNTIRKLCMVFNASLNTPTIAADAPELQNVFKKVEWIAEDACAAKQHLEGGIRRYIRSVRQLLHSFGEDGDTVDAHVFSKSPGDGDIEPREDIYVICGKLRQIQERVCRETGEDDRSGELLTLLLQHLRKMLMVLPQLALQGPKLLATTLYDYFCRVEQGEIDLHGLVKASYTHDLKPVLQTLIPFPAMTVLPEDEVSNKVKKVAQIIEASNFTTRSRAIVFVRRRKTAIQLAEIMEKIPSLRALNPTRFIGHNSFEGMSWQEEQKPTLERFRRGMIRLLVATSVLEEGLDVPECSLVIQFDGITGMTSLVQSRGRARQLEGRFVVMCTQDKREKLQNIIDSELMMAQLARIAANDLKSKSAARQLMSERSTNGMMAHDGDERRGSSRSKGVEEALAEWSVKERKFCVLLGSMQSGEHLVERDRDAALRAIRDCNIADIAAVDQGLNLVALDVVEESFDTCDFISCYERLCCLMSFRIECDKASSESSEPGFWMRILKIADDAPPTDGSDILTSRRDDGATERPLLCNSFHRGRFITEQSFRSLDEYDIQRGETRILKVDNLLVIEVGVSYRFEFDLRALHNRLIYKDTVTTNQWILYGTFFHAPKVWEAKTATRICADFHMKALSFAFHVNASTAEAMRQLCKELVNFGVEVRDTKVKRLESAVEPVPPTIDSQPAMLVYASQVLASTCCFALGAQLPAALLDTVRKFNDDEIAVQALLRFQPTATTGGELTTEFRDFVARHFPSLKGLAKLQQRVVLKVIVTPTRILFERPEVAPENRVFRHFDPRHFLFVYFRDENRELLEFSDALAQRFRTVMTDGVRIGLLHFQFLGGTLSQMRNSSCIFTSLDPQEVRTWMGELHTIMSPAKYLKRLGQAFSFTRETVTVHPQVLLEPEDDIEDDTRHFVFTDGCGEISIAAAKQVSSILALPVVPSAFQIRLGGAKGVLVMSDIGEGESSDQDTGDEWGCRGVKLRKSMVKFKAPHRTLEIVGVASAHSVAYLTRQSIALLSDLGIPDVTFLSLQDEFIASLAMKLVSGSLGLRELRATLPLDQVWWMDILYG